MPLNWVALPSEAEMIAMLRAQLVEAPNEALQQFLEGHALGFCAAALIARMTPNTRLGFFASMRAQYPEAAPAFDA